METEITGAKVISLIDNSGVISLLKGRKLNDPVTQKNYRVHAVYVDEFQVCLVPSNSEDMRDASLRSFTEIGGFYVMP